MFSFFAVILVSVLHPTILDLLQFSGSTNVWRLPFILSLTLLHSASVNKVIIAVMNLQKKIATAIVNHFRMTVAYTAHSHIMPLFSVLLVSAVIRAVGNKWQKQL
jgi:hypothetical protein